MKAGLEKAQQLSGFAHSVLQTPELCCNPVTCHEAADVAEAIEEAARSAAVWFHFRLFRRCDGRNPETAATTVVPYLT